MHSNNDQDSIEEEFIASWNWIEVFFTKRINNYRMEWLKPMLNLIAELRQHGHDKKLRAGQSLEYLVLSRSREHGLRRGQSMLRFELIAEGGITVYYFEAPDVRIRIEVEHVALTPEIETLLTRLLSHPID